MAAFHFYLAMTITAAAAAAAAAAALPSPSCGRRCGDVDIPYPFGMSPGCYLDGFDITCDVTSSAPRPFIGNTSIELIDVSLPLGQARTYKYVDWICYNASDMLGYDIRPFNLSARAAYRISDRHNRFTAVGCRTIAFIGGENEKDYVSGCVSVCYDLASVQRGNGTAACNGVGCCQTAVPEGLTSMESGFAGGINNSQVWDFNPCSYAFIVEQEWYNFSSKDLGGERLFSERHKSGVPVVLDWSVGAETCEQARRNSSSFACVDANSECSDSRNGRGYTCNCASGYQGNPYLHNGCQDVDECSLPMEFECHGICTNTQGSYTCSCPRGKTGDPTTKNGCYSTSSNLPLSLKLLIASIACVFFLAVLGLSLHLGFEKRKLIKAKQKFFEQNGGLLLQRQMKSCTTFRLFTHEELEAATDRFAASRIIGRGGHGTVYRGTLQDNRSLAIKKAKIMDARQTNEFATEMLILSQINHKNVIRLLGCCLEVEVPMLVYEFISNGNLFEYLHSSSRNIHRSRSSITLATRLRIAAEVAEALAYLHSSASTPIIHGDVKSANILLDDDYTAKVSDFGASRLAPKDEEQLATFVQGTCGYLDPEYLLTCQLTDKSDVFSFGVVVLELLTGRKALEFDASGEEMILATSFLSAVKENRVESMVDPGIIKDEEDMRVVKEVAQLAVLCLNFKGHERPTMKDAAEGLARLRKSKQLADMKNESSVFVMEQPISAIADGSVHEQANSGQSSLEAQALLSIERGR